MPEKPPLYTVTDRRKFTTDGALREGRPPDTAPEPPQPAASENFATPETASPTAGPGLHLVDHGGQVKDAAVDRPGQPSQAAAEATQSRTPSAQSAVGGAADSALLAGAGSAALDDDQLEDDGLGPAPTPAEAAQQKEAYRRSSDLIDTMVRQANPGAPASIEMDFEQLVQSIYVAAIVAMGAGGEPGQKPRIDIVGARQSIDMLAVLGDKTKGNLSEGEQRLLQSALFNLRMMFLEITNALASQAQRPPAASAPLGSPQTGGQPGPRPPGRRK